MRGASVGVVEVEHEKGDVVALVLAGFGVELALVGLANRAVEKHEAGDAAACAFRCDSGEELAAGALAAGRLAEEKLGDVAITAFHQVGEPVDGDVADDLAGGVRGDIDAVAVVGAAQGKLVGDAGFGRGGRLTIDVVEPANVAQDGGDAAASSGWAGRMVVAALSCMKWSSPDLSG